jgi:hypothetical protein
VTPRTLMRLAVAGGRSDTARILLTALGASLGTIALLAAATVLSIVSPKVVEVREDGTKVETYANLGRYSNELLNEPGLRPGVAIALMMFTIPILAFVAQCGKLGAPARERRLAAFRMAGANPRQVAWIAAAETGVAAVLGVAFGIGLFLAGRIALDRPDARGRRPLPTDVLPDWPAFAAVGIGVPLFVTLLAVLALRRVAVTPLGVLRTATRPAPRPWPGLLIATGIGIYAALEPLNRRVFGGSLPDQLAVALVLAGLVLVSIGVVTGTGWLTHFAGRLLHRFARRPAALLAGRRMMADPWAGSRTFAALLVALLLGAMIAGAHAWTATEVEVNNRAVMQYAELAGEPAVPSDTAFYARAYELIDYALLVAVAIAALGLLVALADGVVTRRRTLTALIAGGTPRGVLSRAMLWQVLAPAVPAIAIAVSAGIVLPRRLVRRVTSGGFGGDVCKPAPGDPAAACLDPGYFDAHHTYVETARITMDVPVPWAHLALLGGSALAAVAVVSVVGLLFLRMSTNVSELRTG